LKYLEKKRNKNTMKKYCYKCRKQVAEKRLRIKGRFVTKVHATGCPREDELWCVMRACSLG
jgi:hypothetical protein